MHSQLSKEWFAERAERLTASRFAAAMGICPYTSRQKLYREYMGLDEPFLGNEATKWGQDHEKDAIYALECETGLLAEKTGFWVHPDYHWLGGSPDGLIGGSLIEVKCPYYKNEPHQEVPIGYMAQIQGCMEIAGYEWCLFGSWTEYDFTLFKVDRNKEYWDFMLPKLEEFWGYVQEGKEPKRKKKTYFEGEIKVERLA